MGWQVYDRLAPHHCRSAASALNVSLIGLVTFAAAVPARPARRRDRRPPRPQAARCCSATPARCWPSALLAGAAFARCASVPLLLGVALLFGASRAFFSPAIDRARARCWCRAPCCRAPSPGIRWPGSPPRSIGPGARPACWSRCRPALRLRRRLRPLRRAALVACSADRRDTAPARAARLALGAGARRVWPTSGPTRSSSAPSRSTSRR